MNCINNIKKNFKAIIKNKISFTEKTFILFLMTGSLIIADVKLKNNENLKVENNNYIVNIEKVDENKVSHNEFNHILLEENEGLIFNNSIRKDEKTSKLLNKKLDENHNLENDEANLIIAEISKNNKDDFIKGSVEIYGNKADLLIIDEEGLEINGARFDNVNNLTLAAGKLNNNHKNELKHDLNGNDMNMYFDSYTSSIKIGEKGIVSTNKGDRSLNILAKYVDINGKIGDENNHNEDIYIISKNDDSKDKSYINLNNLSKIYGRNIYIKAEGNDVGIKHNNAILYANNNIEIDAKSGNIEFNIVENQVKAGNDIKLSFKNTDSIDIKSKVDAKIIANNNLNINILNETATKSNVKEDISHSIDSIGASFKEFINNKNKVSEDSKYNLVNKITPNNFKIGKFINFEYVKDNAKQNKSINVLDVKLYNEIEELIRKREKETAFDEAKKEFLEDNENQNIKLSHKYIQDGKVKVYKLKNNENVNLIDIDKANGEGISHNYYEKLKVKDNNTLLLNNNIYYESINSSALKREIKKVNNNLENKVARLIINELDDSNLNASINELFELSGNIEVLSNQKADVLFINKNGIVVNNAKFYNISNLALSTSKLKKELEGDYLFENANGKITINNRENLQDVDVIIDTKELEIGNDLTLGRFIAYVNDDFENKYNIASVEDLKFRFKNKFSNKAEINALNLSISSKEFENNGRIETSKLTYIFSNDKLHNKGIISSDKSLTLRSNNDLINDGDILHNKDKSGYLNDKDIFIQANKIDNNKNIYAVGGLAIYSNRFNNNKEAKIETDKDIRINTKDLFTNNSTLKTKEELIIETNSLKNLNNLYSSKVDILVYDKLENLNKALISAGKNNLKIKAKNIKNDNSTILSFSGFNLEALESIENINEASIKSQNSSNSILKAYNKILNKDSSIYSFGNLDILTTNLENIGSQSETLVKNKNNEYERSLIVKESRIKSWFNGYNIKLSIPDEKNYINIKNSEIISGNDLIARNINPNLGINITNINSAILSKRDIKISGNLENRTTTLNKNAKEILENIKIDFNWDTRSLVNKNTIFQKGNDGRNISLYQALKEDKFSLNNGKYLSLLRNSNIYELDKILDLTLGKDWKAKEKLEIKNIDADIKYYNLKNHALVSAGKNIYIEFGNIINSDASKTSDFKGYRDEYKSDSFYERVEGLDNIDIISSNNDNIIRFEDDIVKDNGIFEKNVDDKYVYTTKDIIKTEVRDYKVFEILNENVLNPINHSKFKLIGDSYYQYNLITNMLYKIDKDNIAINKEKVEKMLISSSKEANRLNLKLGKALTNEEISNLKEDIIWYVEVDIDGVKVLTPTIYLSNKTLEKIKNENSETFANIKAKGSILTYRLNEITNRNSSIVSNNNTIINSENLTSIANDDLKSNIKANNIIINSNSDILVENTNILSNEDIDIKSNDIDIIASNIDASGDINIKANNINLKDKVKVDSDSISISTSNNTGSSFSEAIDEFDESISSNIKGRNVNISTSEDLNIKASQIEALENVNINSKNVNLDVSTLNNVNILKEENYGNSKGDFTFGDEAIYINKEEKIKKSNIKANNVNINAKENINITSSNIISESDVNIDAKENINIKDKIRKSSQDIITNSIKSLSITSFDKNVYNEKSSNSNIFAKGSTNINAKENINIKSSNIVSNDVNIRSDNLIIESSDEIHNEKTKSSSIGIKGNVSIGAIGSGAKASFDTSNEKIDVEITNEYTNRDKNKLRQLSSLSALASGDTGISLNQKESSLEEIIHNNSKIVAGNNVNFENKDTLDIGGLDITANNNININTGNLKTTKKKNIRKEKETNSEINAKQSISTTSSILDSINTLNEITNDVLNNEVNEGLATLKSIGSTSNLLFNDAAGVNSKQSLGINVKQSENIVLEDTKTNIKGNNISINANKGNIEFNNINLNAEEKLILKAKDDVLINGGKREHKVVSNEINLEQGINQSAGYNVLFGANSQVGTSGNVNYTRESQNINENILSSINAGSVNIETGNDLTLISSEIKSRGNVNAKIGNNLNIKSNLDEIDNNKVKVGAGYNASVGVASNTAIAGRVGVNAEAGYIYEKGNNIKNQTGIEASGEINIDVDNDLNLDGGIINSSIKKGNLKVKNNININNINTEVNAGGAIVGASGGKSGELGLDVEVGDYKNKKEKINSIIGLEKENIIANNVNIDGKNSKIEDIDNDIRNSKKTITDKFKKGGNASLSFSVKDSKEIYEKAKSKISQRKNKNNNYIPKTLTEEEKNKLFNKAKLEAENKDVQKEASKKLEEISKKANNIPKEHLLDKLNELTYGYDNDKVIKYVEETEKTGNKLVIPDTIDKKKLNKNDKNALGEIFKNISPNEEYNKLRKEIDASIYDKLVDNREFKEIINKDLVGNKENIEKLYNIVANAKKEAFKEKTNLDIKIPNLILNDKKNHHLHGHYNDDSVTLGIYPPIKSKDKKDLNKEILNTILHELTHHDQYVITQNKNNINDANLKEASNIFELNQDLYVDTHNNFDKYKNQPLEKEAFKSGDDISIDLISKTFKSNIDSKKLFDEAKKKYRERNPELEAEKKLKLIAENSKNIPKEHLLDAVEKLAYGLSPEENEVLRKKSKEEGKRVIRPDNIEGFEGNNLKNMAKILRNIKFDESYVKLREEINESISKKLDENPEFHKLMNTKLSGNEEGIKALFEMVEKVKRETLKEIANIDGKKAEIDINKDRGALSLAQGYYDKGIVHTNIKPILSFLRSQNSNNKEILNTIIHELTHHDQAEIVRNKDRNISSDAKNDAKLLALNQVFYIGSGATNYLDYKNQPLEREAFLSGDKLGEKLSKLVDKAYKENKNNTNKEENVIKEIKHLGGVNKNLETSKEKKVTLDENALIYGLKDGRKELIEAANKADKNANNAILADSYIGYLNLGFEFSRLSDFAKKVRENSVDDKDIENIANYVDGAINSNLSDSRSRINSANNDDNRRIIKELLSNEIAINALIRMDELNQKEKELLEEIKKNPYVDIDYPKTSSKFTDKENEVIEKYHKVKEGLNETRLDFFAEKTKLIAKETLEKGGQIYFALDGLATDSIKFDKDKTNIDFDRLKDLFNPKSPYYNSVTSRELRYIYENFKDNPNIKFTIKKQVIENPLKDLKLDESNDYETVQNEAFERRILPKFNIKEKLKNLFNFNKNKKNKDNIKENVSIDLDDDFEDIETVRREINEAKYKEEPIYENVNIYNNFNDDNNIIYSDIKGKREGRSKFSEYVDDVIYAEPKFIYNDNIYENLKFKPRKMDIRNLDYSNDYFKKFYQNK